MYPTGVCGSKCVFWLSANAKKSRLDGILRHTQLITSQSAGILRHTQLITSQLVGTLCHTQLITTVGVKSSPSCTSLTAQFLQDIVSPFSTAPMYSGTSYLELVWDVGSFGVITCNLPTPRDSGGVAGSLVTWILGTGYFGYGYWLISCLVTVTCCISTYLATFSYLVNRLSMVTVYPGTRLLVTWLRSLNTPEQLLTWLHYLVTPTGYWVLGHPYRLLGTCYANWVTGCLVTPIGYWVLG